MGRGPRTQDVSSCSFRRNEAHYCTCLTFFAAVCHFNLQDLFAVNGHRPAADVIKPDGAALNSSADAQIVAHVC